MTTLEESNFDVAIVDLFFNEVGLAVAHHLKIPIVGFGPASLSMPQVEFTTVATPASHVPCFLSQLSHEMNFIQRVENFGRKVASSTLCWHFASTFVMEADLTRIRRNLGAPFLIHTRLH